MTWVQPASTSIAAGDLAGKGSGGFPVHVLAPRPIGEPARTASISPEKHGRRTEHHAHAGRLPDTGLDRLGQGHGLGTSRRVHLPVSRDQQGAHASRFSFTDVDRLARATRQAGGSRPSAGRTGRARGPADRPKGPARGTNEPRCGFRRPRRRSAARAIAGIKSGRPVAWLGSTMIGKWLWPWILGTIDRSSVFRVESSNVRIPRSQRITWRLPSERTYSADINRSLTVALMPRLSRIGTRVRPHSLSRSKFCMLRAPI